MKACEIVNKVMTHKIDDSMLKKSAVALAHMMNTMDRGFMQLAHAAKNNPEVLQVIESLKSRCDHIAEEV